MENKNPIDIVQVRNFLDKREKKYKESLRKKLESARKDFDRIVQVILKKYNPTRIYQWGSLLHPENFSEISDIDIAVEGLDSPRQFFTLLCETDELTDFPLDLVELEKIHPLHAESIRKKGKLIYEKPRENT